MLLNLSYFVSYRRATDRDAAHELFVELERRLGLKTVFFDTAEDVIPPGVRWPERLLASVAGCRAVLAVIGPGWLAELERRNRTPAGDWVPVSHSTDWVRKEQALALALGKPFVPVLVGGAAPPGKAQLPPDLELLPDSNVLALPPPGPVRDTALAALVKQLAAGPLRPTTVPAWRPGAPDLPPDEDHLGSRFGQRWGTRTEAPTPHSYDYKFSVLDEERRQQVRVMLLAANETGELAHPVALAQLAAIGEPRKFAHSEKKKGMFFQASCVVTDGMADGVVRNVLLAVRDTYQIHDPSKLQPRNVDGESCVIGTCLTSFLCHDPNGHVPGALLNSLTDPNPWALFSRKLLVPDPLVDCRFLGVGFNFTKQGTEYVHLIWHVRTRTCPPLMLVPARHAVSYDAPVWQPLDKVAEYDFEKAPIDRLVLEKGFGVRFADGRRGSASPLAGFVTCRAFERTFLNAGRPVRWFRDTVVLDLLLTYQQHVHRPVRYDPDDPARVVQAPRNPPTGSADELLRDVHDFVRELAAARDGHGSDFDTELLPGPEGEWALRVCVRDEERRAVYRFLVAATISDDEAPTGDVAERFRRRLHDGFPGAGGEVQALFVLQGVRSDLKYRLQRPVTLTDGAVPVHVVKVALLAAAGPARAPKRVAHALIPVRRGGRADALLFTRSEDDELPRLPGGKVEAEERPAEALARELTEELDLPASELFEVTPVGVFNAETVSPNTGELTRYEFHPFVVRLDDGGAARVRALLGGPRSDPRSCLVAPVPMARWRDTGLGFDPAYPKAVLDQVPPELLDAAAVTVDEAGSV